MEEVHAVMRDCFRVRNILVTRCPNRDTVACRRAGTPDKTAAGISARQIGLTGGDALTLQDERPILVAKLRERFEGWLPAYMAGGPA